MQSLVLKAMSLLNCKKNISRKKKKFRLLSRHGSGTANNGDMPDGYSLEGKTPGLNCWRTALPLALTELLPVVLVNFVWKGKLAFCLNLD